MNTKVLRTSVFIAMILTPSVAIANPDMIISFQPTPYGPLTCAQRSQSKLKQIGATQMSNKGPGFTVAVIDDATINIVCRGQEVLIAVSGPNAATIVEDIKKEF